MGNFFILSKFQLEIETHVKLLMKGMLRPEGNTMGVKGQMNGVNWTMPVSIMVFVYIVKYSLPPEI